MKQNQRNKDASIKNQTSVTPITELDRSPGSSPRRQLKTGTNDVQPCLLNPPTNEPSAVTSQSYRDISRMNNDDWNPNQIVYRKMEAIVERMQDEHSGVPVRTVKSFRSKIPSVFCGADLINWMLRNLELDDVTEALHLANLLAAHGYVFPIDEHHLNVKNDYTYYRFQTPYYWPSRCTEPENSDYAVFLCKRTMQNKTRLELVDYEAENLARLQKMFSRKWEFIFMQAEAQAKVDKKTRQART